MLCFLLLGSHSSRRASYLTLNVCESVGSPTAVSTLTTLWINSAKKATQQWLIGDAAGSCNLTPHGRGTAETSGCKAKAELHCNTPVWTGRKWASQSTKGPRPEALGRHTENAWHPCQLTRSENRIDARSGTRRRHRRQQRWRAWSVWLERQEGVQLPPRSLLRFLLDCLPPPTSLSWLSLAFVSPGKPDEPPLFSPADARLWRQWMITVWESRWRPSSRHSSS